VGCDGPDLCRHLRHPDGLVGHRVCCGGNAGRRDRAAVRPLSSAYVVGLTEEIEQDAWVVAVGLRRLAPERSVILVGERTLRAAIDRVLSQTEGRVALDFEDDLQPSVLGAGHRRLIVWAFAIQVAPESRRKRDPHGVHAPGSHSLEV
jgi:hypothetical protein